MESIHNNHHKREKVLPVFMMLSILVLFPATSGLTIYLPQLLLGMTALYTITKLKIIKPIYVYLIFGLYVMVMSFNLSLLNGTGSVIEIFRSSLRLFFPFIGLMTGGLLRREIKAKSLVKILFFLLIFEFIIGFFQMTNTSFRNWSYSLYRSNESAANYLNNFEFSTGKRIIGTFGNPNTFGLIAVILNSAILILSGSINKKTLRIIVNILSLTAAVYITFNTQSRTSIILFVFAVTIVFYWRFTKLFKNKIFIFIILSIAAVLIFNYFKSGISREISINALDARIELWKVRISAMYYYALYDEFFTMLLGVGYHTARQFGYFDNTYLVFFFSAGIIGVIFYLAVIMNLYMAIKKIRVKEYRHLSLLLLYLLVLGNMLLEFQEIFKLSAISFILLGFTLYSDKINPVGDNCFK